MARKAKRGPTQHRLHDASHVALVGIVSLVAVVGLVLLFITLAPLNRVGQATAATKETLATEEQQLRFYAEEQNEPELAKLADTVEEIRTRGVTEGSRAKLQSHVAALEKIYSADAGLLNALNRLAQAQNQQAVAQALQQVATLLLAGINVQAGILPEAVLRDLSCDRTIEFGVSGESNLARCDIKEESSRNTACMRALINAVSHCSSECLSLSDRLICLGELNAESILRADPEAGSAVIDYQEHEGQAEAVVTCKFSVTCNCRPFIKPAQRSSNEP